MLFNLIRMVSRFCGKDHVSDDPALVREDVKVNGQSSASPNCQRTFQEQRIVLVSH